MCNYLQRELLSLLVKHEASYAKPLTSQQIGEILSVTPSYIRTQIAQLVKMKVVGVRRGTGGGYYIIREEMRQDATK